MRDEAAERRLIDGLNCTPETAHEIGMRFAEYFQGHQVVVAAHTNKAYLHNHLVFNSVNMDTGIMFHQSRDDLLLVKQYSHR